MEREVATTRWDLPHEYAEVDTAKLLCRCTRAKEDQLHSPILLAERAMSRAVLVTEKGS